MGRGTLGRRLVLQVVALVALVAIGLGALTTLAVYQLMLNQLDHQVDSAASRVQMLASGGPPDGGGARQQSGTLIVALPTSGSGTAVLLGEKPGYGKQLSATVVDQVKQAVSNDSRATATITGIGSYRLTLRQATNGNYVVGLPMSEVDRVLAGLVGLEAILALLAMGGAALGARALVARSLRPLNRLAATATQVSELELGRGDVALAVRVPEKDADPRSEVGRVGLAFNHMLSNVDGALAARQASEMKVRQFVADASHELRNPLASIRGYAELTRRSRDELPPDAAYAMSRVESEAERMSGLVEDLLLLARLDSGPDIDVKPTDLTQLVIDAVSDARAADQGHAWSLSLPDEPVLALGDAHRLHQVVTNLLANARTHTPPGTRVEVGLGPVRDQAGVEQASISVTDDGPGIPEELQHKVFERFTRADASRARSLNGARVSSTGLGLAIVAAVVEAHQGSVRLESRPGRTRFTVLLPRAFEESRPPEPSDASIRQGPPDFVQPPARSGGSSFRRMWRR